MARIKLIPILLAIAAFTVNGFSQSTPSGPKLPDFSGQWEMEDDLGSQRFLDISHEGDRLVIKESFRKGRTPYSNTIELYTDRRGERNLVQVPGLPSPAQVRSETFWKKDKLVRKSSYSVEVKASRGEGVTNVSETDEYSLSKDGLNLIVKTLTTVDDSSTARGGNGSFSMPPRKRVFRRVN